MEFGIEIEEFGRGFRLVNRTSGRSGEFFENAAIPFIVEMVRRTPGRERLRVELRVIARIDEYWITYVDGHRRRLLAEGYFILDSTVTIVDATTRLALYYTGFIDAVNTEVLNYLRTRNCVRFNVVSLTVYVNNEDDGGNDGINEDNDDNNGTE